MADAHPAAAENLENNRPPGHLFAVFFTVLYPCVCLLLGTVSGLSSWAREAALHAVIAGLILAVLVTLAWPGGRRWRVVGGWFDGLLAGLFLLLAIGVLRSPCPARATALLIFFIAASLIFYLSIRQGWTCGVPGWLLPLTATMAAAWGLGAFLLKVTPRVAAPLGHHNYMAGFLLLHIPLTFAVVTGSKRFAARAAWLLALLLQVLALVFTGSLAGIAVGFALAIGIAAWRMAGSRTRPLHVALAVMLVAVLGGAAVLALWPRVSVIRAAGQRAFGIFARGADPSLSLENRLRFARTGAAMLAVHPLAGWGLGSAPLVSALYREQTPGVAAAGEVVPQLHSLPVHLLAETGLPGAILVLALFALLLRRARGAAGIALAAYALFSLADYQLDLPAVLLPIAVIAALAAGTRRQVGFPQPESRLGLAAGLGALLLGSALLLGASSAAHYFHAHGRPDAAVRWRTLCGFYELQAGARAEMEGQTAGAAGAYRQAAERMPNVLPAAEQAGFFMLRASPRAAVPWLERAAALDSYFTLAHFHLGRARLHSGDREGAVNAFAASFLVQPATVYADAWNAPPERAVYSAAIERAIDRLFDMAARYPESGPRRVWNELGTFLIGRRDLLPGGVYRIELFERPAANASIIAFRREAYPLRAAPIVLRLDGPVPHYPAGIGSIRGLPPVRAIDLLKPRL